MVSKNLAHTENITRKIDTTVDLRITPKKVPIIIAYLYSWGAMKRM